MIARNEGGEARTISLADALVHSHGCSDSLRCVVAFGLALERAVRGKPLGDAYDLAAERPSLQLDAFILDAAGGVEDTRRRRDRDDVWDGPRRARQPTSTSSLLVRRSVDKRTVRQTRANAGPCHATRNR